nr:hypothetical protein [uncultured Massilia sp.]
MAEIDPRLQRAMEAHESGRHDEALAAVQEVFAQLDDPANNSGTSLFFTMFLWGQLVEVDPRARAALAALRNGQVRRVLAGDSRFGGVEEGHGGYPHMRERFSVVVDMNEILVDAASTRAMFVELERIDPAQAARRAWRVLPALVETGDYARADRYRGNPLEMLAAVNFDSRTLPLFPPPGGAPRLAADMMGLTRDARIGMAVLRGLGREDESEALESALLDGLESPELRTMAERELREPGAISREVTRRKAAEEGLQLPD